MPTPNPGSDAPCFINVRYQILGGHVHLRVFSGPTQDGTKGLNGTLVYSLEEWPAASSSMIQAGWNLINETPENT